MDHKYHNPEMPLKHNTNFYKNSKNNNNNNNSSNKFNKTNSNDQNYSLDDHSHLHHYCASETLYLKMKNEKSENYFNNINNNNDDINIKKINSNKDKIINYMKVNINHLLNNKNDESKNVFNIDNESMNSKNVYKSMTMPNYEISHLNKIFNKRRKRWLPEEVSFTIFCNYIKYENFLFFKIILNA